MRWADTSLSAAPALCAAAQALPLQVCPRALRVSAARVDVNIQLAVSTPLWGMSTRKPFLQCPWPALKTSFPAAQPREDVPLKISNSLLTCCETSVSHSTGRPQTHGGIKKSALRGDTRTSQEETAPKALLAFAQKRSGVARYMAIVCHKNHSIENIKERSDREVSPTRARSVCRLAGHLCIFV